MTQPTRRPTSARVLAPEVLEEVVPEPEDVGSAPALAASPAVGALARAPVAPAPVAPAPVAPAPVAKAVPDPAPAAVSSDAEMLVRGATAGIPGSAPTKAEVDKYGVRCPACRQVVAAAREPWEACARCKTRHHARCWNRQGRCARCGASEMLPRDLSDRARGWRRSLAPMAVTFPVAFVVGIVLGRGAPVFAAKPPALPNGSGPPAQPALDSSLPGGLARVGDVFHYRNGTFDEEWRVDAILDGQLGTVRAIVRRHLPGGSTMAFTDDKPYRKRYLPLGGFRTVGKETISISGQKFDCDICELTTGGNVQRTTWFATRYPYMVKQTTAGVVNVELVSIELGPGH